MATKEVTCRYCCSTKVVKAGIRSNGTQRYLCRLCNRTFQQEYKHNGCKPGVSEIIVKMAMNGSGIRDTSRVLNVSKSTVIRCLKKLKPPQVSSHSEIIKEVTIVCAMDEQWSFVKKKKCQRWLFYAFDTVNKKVLAHVLGPRTTETLESLMELLKKFTINSFSTDGWSPYQTLLPEESHQIGKIYTQSIERYNLNLRTHIKRLTRKTICFSKSIEMHDKVIGHYIAINNYYASPGGCLQKSCG